MKKTFTVRCKESILTLFMVLMLVTPSAVCANALAQQKTVSVNLRNVTLLQALEHLTNVAGCKLLYNHEQVRSNVRIDLVMNNRPITEILDKCLENTNLTYKFIDNVYVIRPKPASVNVAPPQKAQVVSGIVLDEKKLPVVGASVLVKGTRIGTSTGTDGKFELKVPADLKDVDIVVSFIGMTSAEQKVKSSTPVMIVLKEDSAVMDNVVVTGYVNIDKRSFTGNSVTITNDELMKASPRNVFAAVQAFDPSVRMVQNNLMGSNPNQLPDMRIRGNSSLGDVSIDRTMTSTSDPNQPIYVMDGFEITAEKLYDYDINRIESITVLKDAAATAMYGSRAANGVWVITTVKPQAGRVHVNYIMQGEIVAPDLSDYNLMNARQKLDAELAAGYYGTGDEVALNNEYNAKLNAISSGVDTYWLAKPLRTVFNHKHSIYVDGGADDVRYGVELKYDTQGGVMKESFRNRMGAGVSVEYRHKGLLIRNKVTYGNTSRQESPYGTFSDYTRKLPYDKIYDELGNVLKNTQQWHTIGNKSLLNPIYEATLKNFNKGEYGELIDNLNIQYDITSDLQLRGSFSVTKTDENGKIFYDPKSTRYESNTGGSYDMHRGELFLNSNNSLRWTFNAFVAYNKSIGKHNINASLGWDVNSSTYENASSQYKGFPSGMMSEPAYAKEIVGKPSFSENKTRLIGGVFIANYTYNNIYLVDLSARLDGSSQFGANKRYAPFWSGGLGMNIHNLPSFKEIDWLSEFKIRGSYGQLGKVNFPPYAAVPTYTMYDSWYSTGFGGIIKYMGNENLSWEVTNVLDLGFTLSIMKDLFRITSSYYRKKTVDSITDINLPSSSGFTSYKDNLGEIMNKGFEVDVRANVLKTKNMRLTFWGNFAHNKNEILKISDAVMAYNNKVNEYYSKENTDKTAINTKYTPGGSVTSIYAMRSLGIDPANGKDMFLKRDGTITYDWSADEQVVVGNLEPKGSGSFGVNLTWKQFEFFASLAYEFGAQRYNSTLVSKVENVDIYNDNADLRVLTDRWKKPGDVTIFKDIADKTPTRPTSRFVQDYNCLDISSLSLGYNVELKALKRIGISALKLNADANNVLNASSIRQERGLSYPFARTFSFRINLTF